MIRLYDDWVEQVSDRLDRGRPRGGRLGRLEDDDQELGGRMQIVGDDVFVPTRRSSKRGIDEGIGNALLVKLNQIGTVSETLEAVAMAARRRLRERHLAPVGRNRRHDHRRPRRRRPAPAKSRPARQAAPIASQSTTSCCASRRRWQPRAVRGSGSDQAAWGKRLKLTALRAQLRATDHNDVNTSRPHRPRRLGTSSGEKKTTRSRSLERPCTTAC